MCKPTIRHYFLGGGSLTPKRANISSLFVAGPLVIVPTVLEGGAVGGAVLSEDPGADDWDLAETPNI